MTPDQLYANMDFVPGAAEAYEALTHRGAEWRAGQALVGRARLNQAYGDHEREALDLYLPTGRPAGLLVFIHGGYWRGCSREEWAPYAAGVMERDWAVAMPSYPLCPEVSIAEITASVARAVDAAAAFVPGGDIAIAGHSAGGHLAARMACADVDLACRKRVRRVMPLSPLSDLRPLVETAMNADFGLDMASAEAESPELRSRVKDLDVLVAVGAEERPVFLDQAGWLARAWNVPSHVLPGRHHFDVLDPLEDENSGLVRWITGVA